jgi:hypothetical protein
MTLKTTRRRFLEFGASGFGLAVAGFPGLCRPASAAGLRSRYLINLQSFGGVDSAWGHSPMLVRDTNGLSTAQLVNFYGVYPGAPRFPDNLAKPMGNGVLGITMNAFTSSELNRMAILRGMMAEGSHDVGNRMMQNGHLSGYAACFSTIVADALARSPDRLRPLHYVQITNTPADFRSQVGFFHGPGIPLNIADAPTWSKLSASDPNNPANSAQLKELLNTSIEALATTTGGALAANSSRKLFTEDFVTSYSAADSIIGKNYAQSAAFLACLERYKAAVLTDLNALLLGSATKPYTSEVLKNYPAFANVTATGLEAALNGEFGPGGLSNVVFPFALADFLVTSDLSAVVDAPIPGGDFHDFNERDMLRSAANMACLRALINRLASVPAPGETGKSLLDQTLIVYSTEFDRQVARTVNASANSTRPGTNHGSTSSAILAGYRVKGNKIVGGRATGSGGQFGAIDEAFLSPLPIDVTTGDPIATGEYYAQRSLLPTVLEIFGLSVPSQQKTEMVSISAIIKPDTT